ncbi:endonuclease domain-containing protein [Microbacterium sp. A84]
MSFGELRDVFADLPFRFRALLALVDGIAESGPETYMRLMLRALGVRFEAQVKIPGVGRVDFLVDGWLIIECDSKEYHEGWDKQMEDRSRDIEAARRGYVTIRPIAADILGREIAVREAIAEIIDTLGPRFSRVRSA